MYIVETIILTFNSEFLGVWLNCRFGFLLGFQALEDNSSGMCKLKILGIQFNFKWNFHLLSYDFLETVKPYDWNAIIYFIGCCYHMLRCHSSKTVKCVRKVLCRLQWSYNVKIGIQLIRSCTIMVCFWNHGFQRPKSSV